VLTANVHQAKTRLSKLIDAALEGEEVIIARDGIPAVKLVPVAATVPNREGGFWKEKVKILDPDWDKPDLEIEHLFYDSVIFAEGERALTPKDVRSAPPAPKLDDDAPSG
jgi:prevent-host-death family protein